MLEARSISAKHFQLNNKISQCCSQHLPAERGQLPHCGVLLACEARTAPNNFLANIVFLGCSFCSNPEPFNISSKFHSCLSGIWPPLARNSATYTWNFFRWSMLMCRLTSSSMQREQHCASISGSKFTSNSCDI